MLINDKLTINTCASTGVHDDGRSIFTRRHRLSVDVLHVVVASLLAQTDDIPVTDQLNIFSEPAGLGSSDWILKINDSLNFVLVSRQYSGELGQQLRAGDHSLHLRLLQPVLHSVLAQVGVQCHHGQ